MMKRTWMAMVSAAGFAMAGGAWADTVWLSELDLTKMTTGWENHPAQANKSIDGNPLSIGGKKFEKGVGTHAASHFFLDLKGEGISFESKVGVDDEVSTNSASVVFRVYADGKRVYDSGVLKNRWRARDAKVDLAGVKTLALVVTGAGDGIDNDHADWADAKFEMKAGARPVPVDPPREEAVVLTPKPPVAPRINGARVYGARPGNPILFTVPATGERPVRFKAEGLPAGLSLNPESGILTGSVAARGEYMVTFTAENRHGKAQRDWKLSIGDRICLTPPMGWNSWNCFASAVDTDKVKSAAKAMVDSGLAQHGWSYINIDDFWQTHPSSDDATLQGPARDANGVILPNKRFPDMKGLADYIHSLGLKAGLYSSPGPTTCGGCVGSWQHEEIDARTYADWGYDYLKYDWCSYQQIAKGGALYDLMKPYFVMGDALRRQKRDIVYSLCQYGMGNVSAWGDKVGGQCWRTTGDIVDTWDSLAGIGFSQVGLEHFAGPGNWNDPDMLIVGWVGWGPNLHPTRLTPNEQYTHISLWCLLCSPLLIGCDMTKFDDFTLGLLTNDEVLEVNQDPLGRQAARVAAVEESEVWAKQMEDGSLAVGLFNRGELENTVTADWSDLKLSGAQRVRDLWRQKDLGEFEGKFEATVPRHGCVLVRLWPK